jgi:alpha-1,6-mannosyltransferase
MSNNPGQTGEKGNLTPSTEWLDALLSRRGYVAMFLFNLLAYLSLALISLAPNGTIGKLAPIHFELHTNRILSSILSLTHIKNATILQLQIAFFLIMLLIFAGYAWGVAIFRRQQERGLSSILTLTIILCLPLIFIPPLLSKDLFSYIFYGKIATSYASNPYVVTPQRFPSDPLLTFMGSHWKNTGSVYGPIFVYFSALLNRIAGRGITANIYVFKGAMTLFHLANILLLWKLLKIMDVEKQRFATMIYAWNPLVLLMSVGGGHNDIMMMTFALSALLLLLSGRRYTGYVALCLSVMVKFITGILVVAYALYLLSRRAPLKKRLFEVMILATILFVVVTLSFLPLWEGASTFKYILQNYQLHNLFSPGGILSAILSFTLKYIFWIPHNLAYTLGGILGKLLLLPIFLVVLWQKPRQTYSELELADCFFAVSLAYLATVSFFNPWYMLWVFVFLPLRPWDRTSRLTLGLGTATILWGGGIRAY